jgi:co-chaperonin GroES (HSP10)
MKWEPVNDYLIVKRHVVEEKVGGLIIPDQPKKINHMWVVVRAGQNLQSMPGHVVILDGLGGLTLELDGEEHKIVHGKHVIAVLDG